MNRKEEDYGLKHSLSWHHVIKMQRVNGEDIDKSEKLNAKRELMEENLIELETNMIMNLVAVLLQL